MLVLGLGLVLGLVPSGDLVSYSMALSSSCIGSGNMLRTVQAKHLHSLVVKAMAVQAKEVRFETQAS